MPHAAFTNTLHSQTPDAYFTLRAFTRSLHSRWEVIITTPLRRQEKPSGRDCFHENFQTVTTASRHLQDYVSVNNDLSITVARNASIFLAHSATVHGTIKYPKNRIGFKVNLPRLTCDDYTQLVDSKHHLFYNKSSQVLYGLWPEGAFLFLRGPVLANPRHYQSSLSVHTSNKHRKGIQLFNY